MIDLEILRNDPDRVRNAIDKKRMNVDIDRILILDAERRTLIKQIDEVRAKRNHFSIEQMKSEGPKIKEDLKKLEDKLDPIEREFNDKTHYIPNFPHSDVPEGKDETENIELSMHGDKKVFDFEPRDHEELLKINDLAEFDVAAKISGNKFYYLKNQAVILEMAILRWAMDRVIARGFTPMTTPDLVRREALYGTGHFPPETDAYLTTDDLYLAGTAEVALVASQMNKTLNQIPVRLTAFSACFRREAGTYGKTSGGLFRVHQFHKIEMVSFVKPDDSETEHDFLLSISEELLNDLGLHYRVVDVCGGDLGMPQARKYDIETWMPGRGGYFETHSCSNDTDFQARRLGIKYKNKEGKPEYLHTLNNTVLASPRILIPILETYQQQDGSIKIPDVLVPYCGFSEIKNK